MRIAGEFVKTDLKLHSCEKVSTVRTDDVICKLKLLIVVDVGWLVGW